MTDLNIKFGNSNTCHSRGCPRSHTYNLAVLPTTLMPDQGARKLQCGSIIASKTHVASRLFHSRWARSQDLRLQVRLEWRRRRCQGCPGLSHLCHLRIYRLVWYLSSEYRLLNPTAVPILASTMYVVYKYWSVSSRNNHVEATNTTFPNHCDIRSNEIVHHSFKPFKVAKMDNKIDQSGLSSIFCFMKKSDDVCIESSGR